MSNKTTDDGTQPLSTLDIIIFSQLPYAYCLQRDKIEA